MLWSRTWSRRGIATPGETVLIESSSGNLGLALSVVCAIKGYEFICVTDPNATRSAVKGIELYGAKLIVVTERDSSGGYLGTRLKKIDQILQSNPHAVWLNQYANPANKNAHAEQTAGEIINQFPKVDWVFVGSGTTGTLGGVAERLHQELRSVKVVAVEPTGSVTFGGAPGKRSIPGIGTSVRPKLADLAKPDRIVTISEERTIEACLSFVRDRHLLVGGSTGSVLAAVQQFASEFRPGDTIVAISPDLGEKYLDTVYDPIWVEQICYGRGRPARTRSFTPVERNTCFAGRRCRRGRRSQRGDGRINVAAAPTFNVVPGSAVRRAIDENRQRVFEAVETAYRLHASGNAINPDSYFLRYPDRPNSRIIALPAHIGGPIQKSGIKWVSSFPDNNASNLARASAVLILNDGATGYPIACIEAALISTTRTAASAALAAERISPHPFKGSIGVIGTGVIARATIEWLLFRGWNFSAVNLFDLDAAGAEQFSNWLSEKHDLQANVHDRLEEALSDSSLILFTTTVLEPYLSDEKLFAHDPTVLHLSLRDICPNVILASQNIVDDVDHCLKARTSVHLAEMETGDRDFIAGTLVDVLDNKVELDHKPRIFSPFGLGVLDIAVGDLVLEAATASGEAIAFPNFFSNSARW